MWSLRLEFRCKIRVHTRGLVPEASPCDLSLVRADIYTYLLIVDIFTRTLGDAHENNLNPT